MFNLVFRSDRLEALLIFQLRYIVILQAFFSADSPLERAYRNALAASNSPSALLKTREIYDVLDGDAKLHSNELDEDVNLPYQSGPMLVETLNHFGLPSAYDSPSRWMYVERLIGHCLETRQIPKMFAYFFGLRRFHKNLQGLAAEETDRRHETIVTAAIGAINSKLLFDSHELRRLEIPIRLSP